MTGLIGSGPGDRELLTLKTLGRLRRADAVQSARRAAKYPLREAAVCRNVTLRCHIRGFKGNRVKDPDCPRNCKR